MSESITWQEIAAAAAELDIEPCAMSAVYSVESAGNGLLPSGRPKILFEGHVFWKELKKRSLDPQSFSEANPDIIYLKWVKTHYRGGEKEIKRLERAEKINQEAAWCSASWGAFQIMGFNYKACGYNSVFDFVEANKGGAASQLKTFCGFIRQNNMTRHLDKNWTGFARAYNGPGYAQNNYDRKLRSAYEKCRQEQAG